MRAPDDLEQSLVTVGEWLRRERYRFTCVTPETHRRVVARRGLAATVQDVFGWSLPFAPALLPAPILAALYRADALEGSGTLVKSRVRFSTLGEQLYVHSAYPTDHSHAVFFGPDTYRFCAALAAEVSRAERCVDLGSGTGAGGLSIHDRCGRVTLTDCNPLAVTYARINAALAGANHVEHIVGDLFEAVTGDIDLVIANPPYIADANSRVYCHGGGALGTGLSIKIIEQALARLAPGGKMVLYTGSPIVAGIDQIECVAAKLAGHRRWSYRELDPDVFGEELERDEYATVDRIAAVLLVIET